MGKFVILVSFFKKRRKLSIFIMVLIAFFIFVFISSRSRIYDRSQLDYGTTFSKQKVDDLGLDWRAAYLAILNDLGVKKIRLSAYWDEIEKKSGDYDYSDLDWQIEEARSRGVEVILAVGSRLPRWPECHIPGWVKDAPEGDRQDQLLKFVQNTVERYRNNDSIRYWQIENEPFLTHFGICPKFKSEYLDQEIALVKKMDSRPIIITDSGELSLWYFAAKRADVFGTTMYRNTYSSNFKSYIHYPITPGFFRFKKNIVSLFAHPKEWVVIELQAEPWCPVPYENTTKEERDRTMSYEKFVEMLEFARQAGFKTFYLWGAEYWYWEKVKNNDPRIWNEARKLFNK